VRWVLTGEHDVDEPIDQHLDAASVDYVEPSGVEVLVAHGDAGVGKSRVARRALAEVRARSRLARATAFTWLAATNFDNGTTLHYLGCIAVKTKHGTLEPIALEPIGKMTRERLELLRALRLIVYDEGFSGERDVPEAFVEYLEAVGCNVRLLILGDSQQIQPVKVNASLAEKVDASLVSSIVYRDATRVLLRVQHRQHADAGWAALVRSVGDGTVQSLATHHVHQPGEASEGGGARALDARVPRERRRRRRRVDARSARVALWPRRRARRARPSRPALHKQHPRTQW